MTLDHIETAANAKHLTIFGVHQAIVMLGPLEPGFWAAFTASPEWADGLPDPMDRWSARVIGALATELRATPHFPFGDPPAPFLTWAMNSHAAWQSPVGMLVQAKAGLMVSYRGALEFDMGLSVPATDKPCNTCDAPCQTACPVGALTDDGYDVPKCKTFLRTDAGQDCLTGGCLVRRACPVSQTYGRDPAQSAYHMERFLG